MLQGDVEIGLRVKRKVIEIGPPTGSRQHIDSNNHPSKSPTADQEMGTGGALTQHL